jgi:flavin reductase (DIM6/NTAB) family NADH-FMN oxidoreductase RutF
MEEAILKNMAYMTYGIYVLTTRFEDSMAAIHPNRYSRELVAKSGFFALHILAKEQKDIIERFKGLLTKEKFESVTWKEGETGCPILADCVGCMECRVTQSLSPGNHTLFIGEVVNAIFNEEKTPLCTLDYEGSYLGKA